MSRRMEHLSFPQPGKNHIRRRSHPGSVRSGNKTGALGRWTRQKSAVSIPARSRDLNSGRSAAGGVSRMSIKMGSATGHTAPNFRNPSSATRSFPQCPCYATKSRRSRRIVTQRIPWEDSIGAVSDHAAVYTGSGADVGPTKATPGTKTNSTSKEPGQSKGLSGSKSGVIHLDSTSLGRWTVEHLAWTLSRESTGMTGIDPRISAPRSRLSPF